MGTLSRKFVLAILLLLAPLARADQVIADQYVVNYNAMTTDELPAQVATAYGIVRSKAMAMLNIAVSRKTADDKQQAIPAKITGIVSNLTHQVKDLKLREIRERDAIYYIAEIGVSDGETLVFNLDVTPKGRQSAISIRFQHQFFTQ